MRLVQQVVKGFLRRRWYTASIVAIIAITSALLTTVFAVVDGVLFKPLGYPDESHLVAIKVSSSRSRSLPSVLPEDLQAWTQSTPGVWFTGFRVQPVDSITSIARAVVQPNFFDVVGIRPALGGFAAEDFEQRVSRIEPRILTDEIFRSQFGSDPSAIGRVVILDPSVGYGYRIVGVMPRGFIFPAYQFSVGFLTTYAYGSDIGFNHVIARLPTARSRGELQERVLSVATARNAQSPSPGRNPNTLGIDQVAVEPLGRALGATSRSLFAALLVGAGFLVVVAALNVSSLMAARAIDRRREFDARRALGATAMDIGRLLVLEAALLVSAGVMFSLTISVPLLRFTGALLPRNLALFRTLAVDWRVVAFAAIVAAVLGALIVVWPLRLARTHSVTLGPTRNVTFQIRPWSQRVVVVFQVALGLVLTIAGSLFVASLLSVYVQTPPITTRNTLTIAVRFLGQEAAGNHLAPQRLTRANALIERLRALPSIQAVAVTAYELLDRAYVRSFFKAPPSALNPRQPMLTQAVTADFYKILQPHVVAGRLPTAGELATDESVIVVSQSVASNYWPNASAISQTLTDQGPKGDSVRTFTVVGIVKDVRWHSWDQAPLPMIYGPYALLARQPSAVVLIRTPAENPPVTADVLRAIGEVDPLLHIGRVAPLHELFVDSVRARRFQAWLFGSFAAASLCVVAVGIFGQLAMSTARRTREVGIRMTCGAARGSIIRLIVGEQLPPVFVGLVLGGIGSAWSVRFVRSYLYQITAFDARVWAAAICLMLLTAVAGTLIPALQASRIEPNRALRAE